MTNTLNTPVEALEIAFPFRLERYSLRRGQRRCGPPQGRRRHRARVLLLEPAVVTMQSERRSTAPWGLAGGASGRCGRNVLIHPDGSEEELPSKFTRRLAAGDRLRVETPGGGGWGEQ